MATRNVCPHEHTVVVVESKVNAAHDILRCTDCGVTGHREPVFIYERGKS